MAKARLTDSEIEKIVDVILSWKGKLSWELLLEQVENVLRRPFTRQGLDKQENIRKAFQQAKERLRSSAGKRSTSQKPTELVIALDRIERLEAEVTLLKEERDRFTKKFATWQYNVRSRGVSEAEMNRPLPEVDRDRSTDK